MQTPTAPPIPTLRAPPSAKTAANLSRESRGPTHSKQDAVPELTRSQIERLDSASWSEWQFDFDGNADDRTESGIDKSGAPPRRSSCTDSQFQSRCSTRGSSSSVFSGSSSRSASPNDSLAGHQRGISNCADRIRTASSNPIGGSTCSGTPEGRDANGHKHLSIAELNCQLSSMQMATSALL
jgi:hypothetical protein